MMILKISRVNCKGEAKGRARGGLNPTLTLKESPPLGFVPIDKASDINDIIKKIMRMST